MQSALLLINELSSSSYCKSLSRGIDTIPPSKFAKCAITHSYLFFPIIAILLPLNPMLYMLVPNLLISSSNFLYDISSYLVCSFSLCLIKNAVFSP